MMSKELVYTSAVWKVYVLKNENSQNFPQKLEYAQLNSSYFWGTVVVYSECFWGNEKTEDRTV